MKRVLSEPLLHFLILGGGVFALFAAFGDVAPPPAPERLEISTEDVTRLVAQFEAQWRRPPSPEQLTAMIDRLVIEEVYVREARALGLDRGDAIVRQRLAQKMLFLTESGAEAAAPDDATLQAHLEAHPERFRRQATVSFEHILLPEAPEEAASAIEALRAGAEPDAIAIPSLLPGALPPSPRSTVDSTLGDGFFDAIAPGDIGAWSGPFQSAYGSHAVRLSGSMPAQFPPLAEIREAVERDWRDQIRTQLAQERLAALIERYDVVTPDLSTAIGQ